MKYSIISYLNFPRWRNFTLKCSGWVSLGNLRITLTVVWQLMNKRLLWEWIEILFRFPFQLSWNSCSSRILELSFGWANTEVKHVIVLEPAIKHTIKAVLKDFVHSFGAWDAWPQNQNWCIEIFFFLYETKCFLN